MSFYGNIINYLTKAFKRINIKANNASTKVNIAQESGLVEADQYDDVVQLGAGNTWIDISKSGSDKEPVILISHKGPAGSADSGLTQYNFEIYQEGRDNTKEVTEIDISSGTSEDYDSTDMPVNLVVYYDKPIRDNAGHINGFSNKTKKLNINTEINSRKIADKTLQANIDTEETERKKGDQNLQDQLDAEKAQREAADKTLQANIDEARKDSVVTLESYNSGTDNELVYILYQDYATDGTTKKEIGKINIPLDLILQEGNVVEYKDGDELPAGVPAAGIYIHLAFATGEGQTSDVYIDVKNLNEIAGNATETIEVLVSDTQQITANVRDNSLAVGKLDTSLQTLLGTGEGSYQKMIETAKAEAINEAKGLIFNDDGNGNIVATYVGG